MELFRNSRKITVVKVKTIDEREDNKMSRAKELAETINKAHDWEEVIEELNELCELAGIENEWKQADGDDFEDVIDKAADILGVEIF